MTTIEPESGFIRLHIPPGCEGEVELIIQELKKTIMIEPLEITGMQKGE